MARFWEGDSSAGLGPLLLGSPSRGVSTPVAEEDTEDARVDRGTDDANGRSSSDAEPGRWEATDGRRRFAEAPDDPCQSPSGKLRFELEALRFSTAGEELVA